MLQILDFDKLKEDILIFFYERKTNGIQNPVFANDLISFCKNKHELITVIELLEAENFISAQWNIYNGKKQEFAILPLEGQGLKKVLDLVKEKERQKRTILTLYDKVNYYLEAVYKQEVQKIINDLNRRGLFGSSYEPQSLYNAYQDYAKSNIESIINELKNQNLAYFIDKNNPIIIEKIDLLINKAIESKFHCISNQGASFQTLLKSHENKALELKKELLEIWNREATLIALNPKINNEEDYKIMNQYNTTVHSTANDSSSQNVQINIGNINEIEKNNLEQLKTFLKEQGLSDLQIQDLEVAVNSDKQETGQIKLGEKINNWLDSLLTTATPLVLQNAPSIVEAVKKYFSS